MCPTDGDGDGYGASPAAGCPQVADCDDSDNGINPNELELVGNNVDENCDGFDGLSRYLVEGLFPDGPWSGAGCYISHSGDGVTVGGGWCGTLSALTRNFSIGRERGGTGVMLDVESRDGTCELRLTTSPIGSPTPTTTHSQPITATGTQWLYYPSISVKYALRKVEFFCDPHESVTVDWMSIQDAELAMPPAKDITLQWHDIRAPGGGYTQPVIADDGEDYLYMGSDVAGLARMKVSGGSWETANGEGMSSLMMGGNISVVDVLPMEDGSDELYALTGDVNSLGGLAGGLWFSANHGDSWQMLASAWDNTAFETGIPENGTADDIGGYRLESNCEGSRPDNRTWEYGGGRHLQGDEEIPASGDIVYVANNDPDARGVSIWDGTHACALPNSGTALPADPVADILRVNVEPFGTPILLVGYRGRLSAAPGLYVCELPAGGVDCSGTSGEADCWEVDNSSFPVGWRGVDARDFQLDYYAEDVGETGIFVVDGGNRPVDTDADGRGESCNYDEAKLTELFLEDDSSGNVSIVDYRVLADSTDLPMLGAAADWVMTGVSMDRNGEFVVVNLPATPGTYYATDRAYRADAADVYTGFATWEALNSGEDPVPAIDEVDFYEEERQSEDADFGGAWLESSIAGLPAPFPARSAPGTAYDTYFVTFSFATGSWVDFGLMGGGYNGWLVDGITAGWADNEGDTDTVAQPEGDVGFTFWPNIDTGERSYQTTVVQDVAIDSQGHIWSAAGDVGLEHFGSFTPFDPDVPEGAEIDCAWEGWHASASSVSVGTDDSVWMTMQDQTVNSGDPYPHNIGVLRTEDKGVSWQYAAAGWATGTNVEDLVMNVDFYGADGERLCVDNAASDRIMPFDQTDPTGFNVPEHAFSLADEHAATAEDSTLITWPTFGITTEVRAVDRNLAVALFQPTEQGTSSTDGGFYFTTDAGGTWHPVEFDGDWNDDSTVDCDERAVYQSAFFELVHPGSDSFWTANETSGEMEDFALDFVLVAPYSSSTWDTYSPLDSGTPKASHCSIAHVSVQPDSGSGSGYLFSWEWIPMKYYTEAQYAPNTCGVYGRNIQKLSVSPWSDEVYFWGQYLRDFNPTTGELTNRYGGACAVDLNTKSLTMLVNPAVDEYSIGAVAPHPDVVDLLAVLPTMDLGTWQQCYQQKQAGFGQVRCPDAPWPQLLWKTGPNWSKQELHTMPPAARPSSAQWSHIGVPDDRDDGDAVGSWLVVGEYGAGAWRGEVTW